MIPPSPDRHATAKGFGCSIALACLNAAAMSLLALSFMRGPYSSEAQEIWYRYGSLGFLLLGAVIPAATLLLWPRRHPILMSVTTGWMIAVWVPFIGYALMSGGGL